MTDSLKAELIERIAGGNVLVVVGTGVSITVTERAPLASWNGLIANGIERCVELNLCDIEWAAQQKQQLNKDLQALLGVAEEVSYKLGWNETDGKCQGDWSEWLRNTVGTLKSRQPQLIEAIRNLDAPIATLNYDNLLTDVTHRRPLTWQRSERWPPVLKGEDQAILHLHGHWDSPSSVVLGVRSYDAVLSATFAQHLQRALASLRSLLFIGCSGTLLDPNFSALCDWMRKNLRSAEHRHFLLLRHGEDPPVSRELLREARIFCLEYGKEYRDLLPYLQSLVPSTSLEEPSSTVPSFSPVSSRRKVFGNVPPRNHDFTGREDILAQLHQLLMAPEQPTATSPVAIIGLGGLGKTSVANEYSHRYAAEYGGVWWAPAESRAVLIASLATLAIRLNPQLAEEKDQEKVAQAGLAIWSEQAEPVLIVYDNVETPDVLRGLLPSGRVRVLLTTRWSIWSGRATELVLETLGPPAAVGFLQRRAKRIDLLGAERLAEVLGYLPLALDHAGAYCRLSNLSFDEYRRRVDKLIARPPTGSLSASVQATFDLAIGRAATESPAAAELLAFCAFIAPEHIPLDLIVEEYPDEDKREEALIVLAAVSLIAHTSLDNGEPAVALHPVVQSAMRARLVERGEAAAVTEQVIHRLSEAFPKDAYHDTSNWTRFASLLPHVLALYEKVFPGSESMELSKLLDAASDYLHGRGNYREAEFLLKQAIAINERILGRNSLAVADQLSNLAGLFMSTGRSAEAEALINEALVIVGSVHGREHPTVAKVLSNLGILYAAAGRYEEAESLLNEALATNEKAFGRDSSVVSIDLSNLANLYLQTGRLAKAEPLLNEIIETGRKAWGTGHPTVADRMSNLAFIYSSTGRTPQAEKLLQEALTMNEKTVGRDHPATAVFLSNLARLYSASGRYAEAEQVCNEALAINEKSFGRNHPKVTSCVEILARLLVSLGRVEEAVALRAEYSLK